MVLASSHEKMFSSGANLGGLRRRDPARAQALRLRALRGAVQADRRARQADRVRRARATCSPARSGIALACDLIVASEEATFGTPEINVGAFPFMIMALIYRNVPRKKANELLLLGERWSAQEALAAGIVNRVVPAEELDAAVRRVGGQARRQVAGDHAPGQGSDAPPARHAARRRPRLPARAADAGAVHRGHRRGRERVLREARAAVEGPLMGTAPADRQRDGRWGGPLRAHRRRLDAAAAGRGPRGPPRADQARRRRGEDRKPARAGEAHRARAARAADRRGHVHRARHPRAPALLPARDGGHGGARRRRDHRLREGRRAPGGGVRVRLHRDGRLDGDDRRAEGHPPARARADQAHPLHLAARLRRRAHPGGGRLAVRGLRAPVPRGGRDERRDPADRRADGPVRRRHRLHPRPGRLRADGQGPRLDGARRPAPGAGGRRRGRHPGGTRRLARALPQVGRRRPRGRRRRGVHRAIKQYLSFMPQNCEARPPVRHKRATRWSAWTRSCSTCCPSPTASPTTCTR